MFLSPSVMNTGITIHVHPDSMPLFITEGDKNITRHQKIVLSASRGLKNTYGGRTNIRFTEANRVTDITQDEWDAARQANIEAKLLNKAGAITITGQNIIQWTDLRDLRS